MKSKTFALLLFLLSVNLYSQKDYFNYNQITVKDIAAIEAKFDSYENFPKFKTFYASRSKAEYAQPKCFTRKINDGLPSASVRYYYTKNDSIVRDISYNWKINIYKVEQSKRSKVYNTEFDKVVKFISKQIGEPEPGQGKKKTVEDIVEGIDGKKSYSSERRVEWKYKNCKITASLIWSKEHGESFITNIKWEE
ncbi:MAG: hypothetical protein ABIQ27_11120 [Flavobacterium sp.]|uniref:hypothetical protein n=1 Tax=Flavobacterium sp. TaxID=239 RepID=UPI0032657D67